MLSGYGSWIHAIELNGLRSWDENSEAMELARAWQLPAISGGDRHGLEPNANLNLTHAATFAGIRGGDPRERLSTMLFMPQYRETLGMRWFETVKDIVRCHPEAARPRWVDRFFYQCEDGVTRPIAELWPNEGPALLRSVFAMLRLSESQSLRAALRLTVADPAEAAAGRASHPATYPPSTRMTTSKVHSCRIIRLSRRPRWQKRQSEATAAYNGATLSNWIWNSESWMDDKVVSTGAGRTGNMSSGGVLFHAAEGVPSGPHVEFAVRWPAVLGNAPFLELRISGVLSATTRGAWPCA